MNDIKIKQFDPYSESIKQFVMQQFPFNFNKTDGEILELVFNEIMATKKTRLGAKPSPEVQVNIREVIRHYMEEGKPIPFMIPWGSEKPNGTSVDIAELSALKTILLQTWSSF